jgi:hypothetical protein
MIKRLRILEIYLDLVEAVGEGDVEHGEDGGGGQQALVVEADLLAAGPHQQVEGEEGGLHRDVGEDDDAGRADAGLGAQQLLQEGRMVEQQALVTLNEPSPAGQQAGRHDLKSIVDEASQSLVPSHYSLVTSHKSLYSLLALYRPATGRE